MYKNTDTVKNEENSTRPPITTSIFDMNDEELHSPAEMKDIFERGVEDSSEYCCADDGDIKIFARNWNIMKILYENEMHLENVFDDIIN